MHRFCNYTHGWFLLVLLNLFPMTFMSPNWAKCGEKFPAVLIVLGSDVRRTESYVWIDVIVIHLHSVPSSRCISLLLLPLLGVSDTRTHIQHTVPFSMWHVKRGRNQNKGPLSRWGSFVGLMSNTFLCSPACVPAPMLTLSPRTIDCNEWVLPRGSVN